MTSSVCIPLVPDSSVYVVSVNTTHTHYSCRGGYRYWDGDYHRSCDSNGTWTGQALLCIVDSVMPKTYLVILIVGATIAIFVACIPYDFYRFRKRKKKVRDHQERLSLVTRIAPSHAAVVVDTDSDRTKPIPEPPRKFGLKSLFSVFRFVGGKLKTTEAAEDTKTYQRCDTGKGKSSCEESASDGACGNGSSSHESGSGSGVMDVCGAERSSSFEDGGVDTDIATGSTFVLNPCHSSSCPAAENDIIDLCGGDYLCDGNGRNRASLTPDETSDDADKQLISKDGDRPLGKTGCAFASSKFIPNIHKAAVNSITNPCVTQIHEKPAIQGGHGVPLNPSASCPSSLIARSLASRRAEKSSLPNTQIKTVVELSTDDTSRNRTETSDPATVQVTSINKTAPRTAGGSSKNNGEPSLGLYLTSSTDAVPKSASTTSTSSSSPDLGSGRRDDAGRTFHFQSGDVSNNIGYHSMPAISNVP